MVVRILTVEVAMVIFASVTMLSSVYSFTITTTHTTHHVTSKCNVPIMNPTKCYMCATDDNNGKHDFNIPPTSHPSRRVWLTKMLKTAAVTASVTYANPPLPSMAVVYVDPDVYGDKELKVATVNKLRQNIRDAINQDPQLAPLFLKVALQDALTYNAETELGGPDGNVVSIILSPDAPSALSGLRPAALRLVDIYQRVKRTTAVTMADLVTFAGAEAIESAGGPRVVVQLGKVDSKGLSDKMSKDPKYVDLCGENNGKDIVNAFAASGLNERDLTLVYGAIASMEQVVDDIKPEEEVEEEENEMGDKEIFIPSSFGSRSQIYGKRLGTMNGSVFVSVASDIKKKKKPIADVFTNDKVGEWVTYYASKEKVFLKDLPDAYRKIMSLGRRYTGGKIESLLGGADDE